MKNSLNLKVLGLSLLLTASCSTSPLSPKVSSNTLLESKDSNLVLIAPGIPGIPEKAFFPIHPSLEGVYYSWRNCNFIGLNCKYKEVLFKWDSPEVKWMKANDMGMMKRPMP